MPNLRTDLAMENIGGDASLPGVQVHSWQQDGVELTEVIVQTPESERLLGKPMGRYLTLECPQLKEHDPQARIAVSCLLSEELARLLPQEQDAPVLVVGLGNRAVTPDALGPAVAEKILVTRHILGSGYSPENLQSVCAIAPGVLGVTGIETMELVQSLVKRIAPRAVICIDALAARDSRRIGATVQLSTTGIQPGSGVGNHRRALTKETLGTDVIAIGVPTVIYAATLARDAFALISRKDSRDEGLEQMERELLDTGLGSLIVTPRDVDAIIKNCAVMIAGGVNRALQRSLSDAEIAQMMD